MKKLQSSAMRRQTKHPSQAIACVDLFCGAGGLTHGLIAAGVPVVAGVDFDDACHHPYEANHEGTAFYKRDVAKLEASELSSWFGDAPTRVLAGCAPCQPFSSYAQRYETVGTERWGLLNHFARLIEEIEPDIVTMENVPTLPNHAVFDDFVATLKGKGYDVWYNVVDSADYSLPQRRRRTVLLASLHGPIKLREPDSSEAKTVRAVLKGLPPLRHGGSNMDDPLHTASSLSPLNLERIKVSKPGGSWRDWPKHLIAKCHRKTTGKSYPGVYGRMNWDEPAPTLTTQFYGFGNGRFGHPTQARGLSLREGAILQGFPETYSFVPAGEPIQFKVLGRLIGNAVPVELGRVIGESIIEHVGQLPLQSTNQRGGGMAASMRAAPSSPEASRRMQRVRQKNTSAESALRRELHALGLHYRIQVPVLTKPRRVADVLFVGPRVAVFVDGCFWHGCPQHATWPKQNAEFWRAKILANQERDRDTDARLHADGWEIVRVWAHEAPSKAASRIARVVRVRKAKEHA